MYTVVIFRAIVVHSPTCHVLSNQLRKIVVIAFQWSVFSTQAHLSSLSEKRRFHFNLEIVLHVFTKDLCASDSCGEVASILMKSDCMLVTVNMDFSTMMSFTPAPVKDTIFTLIQRFLRAHDLERERERSFPLARTIVYKSVDIKEVDITTLSIASFLS